LSVYCSKILRLVTQNGQSFLSFMFLYQVIPVMKLFLLVLFVSIAYASDAQVQSTDARTWLTATWKQKGDAFEKCDRHAYRTTLESVGFKISKQNDTTLLEKVSIRFEKGNFYAVADAAQNTTPVGLKIVETTPQYFPAGNAEHDFPKYIRCQRVGSKTLYATVGAEKEKCTIHFTKMS
jgi:hypothetical protein